MSDDLKNKLDYCMSCNKKYNRDGSDEAFYYVMNDTKLEENKDKDIMVGILCQECWNKEEESYRKITGFWDGKEPNKPIGVRKEYKKRSFVFYCLQLKY